MRITILIFFVLTSGSANAQLSVLRASGATAYGGAKQQGAPLSRAGRTEADPILGVNGDLMQRYSDATNGRSQLGGGKSTARDQAHAGGSRQGRLAYGESESLERRYSAAGDSSLSRSAKGKGVRSPDWRH